MADSTPIYSDFLKTTSDTGENWLVFNQQF